MKRLFFTLAAFIVSVSSSLLAEELANVEYLCADWGPAMKLSGKTNEPPQFSDTEEEIYFLKQVTSIKRTKLRIPDPITGNATKDELAGRAIYLCKMKPDGTNKTEIKELWHNPAYPIDTQAQSTWMGVNDKARKIALSITLAGSDLTGIWTMGLDGSNLTRVMMPDVVEGHLRSYGSPSWTPDGQWLVFSEAWRGTNYCRIAKCDKQGGQRVYLTDGPVDGHPRVSPDGQTVVYTVTSTDASRRGIWLMNIDGTNQRRLPNPNDKHKNYHSGTYPAWSPEGRKIFAIGYSSFIADAVTGKKLIGQSPRLEGKRGVCGWPHWGRLGFVGFNVGGILFTDSELKEAKWLCSSGLANSSETKSADSRW